MRILTWNVLDHERERRVEVLTDRLRRVGPDIVLLQETSQTHAAEVGRRLGMEVAACGRGDRQVTGDSVPAVLCSSDKLTPDGDATELTTEGRPYVVLLRLRRQDGTEMLVGSVHLAHSNRTGRLAYDPDYVRFTSGHGPLSAIGDDDTRSSVRARLQQIASLEKVTTDSGTTPTFLGGDFNFVAYGAEYRSILELGLRDAWTAGPRLGSRDTIMEYNPLIPGGRGVYDERPPDALSGATGPLDYTLDYQFVTAGVAVLGAWTVGRPDENDPEWVSDHLGLAVDYELPERM